MNINIKDILQYYLAQLELTVSKIPADMFSLSLTEGMLTLEMNAKVAANMALRGYCPLVGKDVVSFFTEQSDKQSVQQQISQSLAYLDKLPEIGHIDEQQLIKDKAGFAEVALPPSAFIHQYILPNFYFHISMVYAIARANGVELSKGNFDGFHSYPSGFSFLTSP
ncbi:hypothetical protein GCM10011369_29020 [Neiella marina]|uniref:DUF1993 domain-containing protein n=1 Tax=Neiella marina TaxID=508461 RepID=A0A8J2U897_9GAMM|nr:DUF1993 family protein [Neiella marina]GGA85167.1 hypothetical protein GCM10011369_29020 [Neiella marina]